MEYIFDIFYEEMFESMNRNGLQTRQSRRDVIDRLNSVISGCMGGHNLSSEEFSKQAVLSAIDYHQRYKEQNGNVCIGFYFIYQSIFFFCRSYEKKMLSYFIANDNSPIEFHI